MPAESYLYLHAPTYLSREESFDYHITTRNFFAWLMGVPIVGYDPASALVALKDRMDLWRDDGSDNLRAISQYVADQGYGDMSDLEAQLPQDTKPVFFTEPARPTFDPAMQPTLVPGPRRRPSGIDLARKSLRRMSQTFGQKPHIAVSIRSQKSIDQLRAPIPLSSGDLATIAYSDTVADTPPSTTTRTPRSKDNRTIGRNSVYTEIFVPDYGNGLYHQAHPVPEPATTPTTDTPSPTTDSSSPTATLLTSIPTSAFTHLPTTPSSRPASIHSTTSHSSHSSTHSAEAESIYSAHSPIPSLSSSYSTTPSLSDGETTHPDASSSSASTSSPETPTTPSFPQHMHLELPVRKRPRMSEEFLDRRARLSLLEPEAVEMEGREGEISIDAFLRELEVERKGKGVCRGVEGVEA